MKRALLLLLCALAAAFAQSRALDCGTVVDAAIDPGGNPDFYNFSASAGDALIVRMLVTSTNADVLRQPPRITLTDPASRAVSPRSNTDSTLGAGATFVAEYDLTRDGGFQIKVENRGAVPVPYRLVYTWLNKPCASTASLFCGASASGTIGGALQLRTYQFAAKKDDLLSVRLAQTGTVPKGFNIAAFAYGPSGQLARTATGPALSDTSSSSKVRFDFRAPADGAVTLLVYDKANTTGGSYSVVLVRLGGPSGPCSTDQLSCGRLVQGKITGPLNVNTYSTLPLNPGDVVTLRVTEDGNGAFNPLAEILDSQGSVVTARLGRLPVSGRIVNLLTFTVQAAGTYTVAVQDASTALNTGSYALALVPLNRPCSGAAPLTCGSIVDGSLSGLLATNMYSLAANANDKFMLRVLNNTQNALFVPRFEMYDAQGNNIQTITTSDISRQTFAVSAAGNYTVVLSDAFDNSQSGSYTLGLTKLNGTCGSTAPATLTCGALQNGSFTRPLETPAFSYTAGAGQSFTVRMIDNTGALQETMEVYDPQGNLVGQSTGGAFPNIDVLKPAGGTYTVLAMDTSRRPAAGPFGIQLLQTTGACSLAAAKGQTVSGVVSAGRPFASYAIPAGAGDALLVRSVSFTNGFSAQMDLYDPSGARLESANFSISRKLTAGGTYTLVVGGVAPRTAGSYAVSWQLLNSPESASALACGASTTGLLTPSGQFRYYTANAAAGDLMRLIFTRLSDNFAPQVDLYDPSGARVTSGSDIAQKAAADGDYLVVVGPSTSKGETGTYSLAYQHPNRPCSPVTLTCGQTTLRTVASPGQLDTFTFTGTPGDQARITLAQRTGAYMPFAELYDGAGNRVATSSNGLVRSTLPAGGSYALLVRDLNAVNTGSYRVSLQDDTKACVVSDGENPAVTLVQPTGGEVIVGGTSYRVQWISDDNVAVANHSIALSTDGGNTYPTTIASGLSGGTQSYDWSVPPDIAPSRSAVVRVTAADAAGNTQSAASGPVSMIGSGFNPNSTGTFTYDALNRLTQAVVDGRTIQYTYDAVGNLVQITVSQ
jgi:YD repeat-containing protein